MFKKNSKLMIFLVLIFYLAQENLKTSSGVFMNFLPSVKQSLHEFMEMNLSSDAFFWKFIFMLALVCLMVSIYSESYTLFYNSKKFFFMMTLFVISMIMMSSSTSMKMMVLSWDYLGLTSVFLVMFYPNKNSMWNSIITFFFNRVGDCIMMVILILMILDSKILFFLGDQKSMPMMLLLICSLTKSAQFPLSSWLPAAMSAPTPISAMVHSSTLVTAGLILNYKINFYLQNLEIWIILAVISTISYLAGGTLASSESDFKKMVAFSTMSQISMIMIFLSLNILTVMILHMFFHAMFKTVLFVCSGLLFSSIWGSQIWTLNKQKKMANKKSLMIMSIYLMSGLIFSSSFFSKDQMLEMLSSKSEILFFMLMSGSILTIIYCSKILSSVKSSLELNTTVLSSKIYFQEATIMMMLFLISSNTMSFMFKNNLECIIHSSSLILMNSILFTSIMISSKLQNKMFNSQLKNLNLNLMEMKSFSMNIISKTSNLMSMFYSDTMMFKSKFFNKEGKVKMSNSKKNLIYLTAVLFFI